MTRKSYTRLELAHNQLKAAIGLFIAGRDRFSVISLAGAADVLLARLVTNEGMENFTQALLASRPVPNGSPAPTVQEYGKGINDAFCINQVKHMDDSEDGFLELDPEECALGAILKAVANYILIPGHDAGMVGALKLWLANNVDPTKYNADDDPNSGQ